MRRAARIDDNQREIVNGLRLAGASVQILSAVGDGCPDILVGYQGVNYLMEIKDGNKSPSKRKLTEDQQKWHKQWKGQKVIVNSLLEALEELKDNDM